MGALKLSLFTDVAKDFVGKIKVANLGVQRELYEENSDIYLLEKQDLHLPKREQKNTHKGTFGHLCVVIGEKQGAGKISLKSAFNFGVGLVTALSKNNNFSSSIMNSNTLPYNTTAIAIGMGLGTKEIPKFVLKTNLPILVDADMFYKQEILEFLDKKNIVLTPHPKEFVSLLKLANLATIGVNEHQNNRFKYVKLFCQKYPEVVLVLKGANVIIAQNKKIYINSLGSAVLSFGGSGDILSGLISSLLAQGYEPINAAISGSLAHTIGGLKYKYNDFSLTPNKLIKQIKRL